MKAKNIFASIALISITTISFAQLNSINERVFGKKNNQVEFTTTDYRIENSKIESWMHDFQGWANERFRRDIYEGPVVSRTICLDLVEIVFDEEMNLENWMAAPFERVFAEEALSLENWMAIPFENSLSEQILSMEGWMTDPFDKGLAEGILTLESWMTIPFDNVLVEEPLHLESWMTSPWI